MSSIYIHIPFCESICSYCDYTKCLYYRKWIIPYLDALKKEIEDNYEGELIDTIYIGGGTPSVLSNHELNYLFEILKSFKLADKHEFTIECNINDIDKEKLMIFKRNNVNRLSIGIQTFDLNILKEMNRKYKTFEETKNIIMLCRELEFNNINIDLIYGFKDQKLSDLKSDLKKFISLRPDHISTYSLLINNHTSLSINKYERLDDDKDAKMYEYICKKLYNSGYIHYEVSNFCMPNYHSRHNLKYWNNEEYYGFGVGASGYKEGLRYDNTKSITNYIENNNRINSELLSKKEIMDTEVLLGLRKLEGINLQSFYDKYRVNFQEIYDIKALLKSKELKYKEGFIFIPEDKIYIMDEILLKIL